MNKEVIKNLYESSLMEDSFELYREIGLEVFSPEVK
jgi:hypothetical protein